MLIEEQLVEMRWNSRNKKHYESLGYKYTKMKDSFMVRVRDLSSSSNTFVKVVCDYCGRIFEQRYDIYKRCTENAAIKKSACGNIDCLESKSHEALVKKYNMGIGELVKTKEFQDKVSATLKEKYGENITNVFQVEEVKDKIRQTNIERYGYDHPNKNPEMLQRAIDTTLKKYGVRFFVETFKGQFIGENSPVWKGGVEYSRVERASYEYTTWRKEVYDRDKYTCQCCGAKGGIELNAHHIENWRDNPDKRYDVNNGISMCSECHMSFHSLYGKRNNTQKQLDEFLINYKKL